MNMQLTITLSLFLVLSCSTKSESQEIRPSALAGTWYNADRAALALEIDRLLSRTKSKTPSCIPALIVVPHAGYTYSGSIAAPAYALLKKHFYDVIYLIGPSHHRSFHGCSVPGFSYYETPLGRVAVERTIITSLLRSPYFNSVRGAHEKEHCLEIQLPFLQRLYSVRIREIKIVPVLAGDMTAAEARNIAHELASSTPTDKKTLFIISTDLAHCGPRFGYVPFSSENPLRVRDLLRKLDMGALDCIVENNPGAFNDYVEKTGITICGRNPLLIGMALPLRSRSASLIKYGTSLDTTGDHTNTVSYASIAVCGNLEKPVDGRRGAGQFNRDDKIFLLKLARDNISSHLADRGGLTVNRSDVPAACLTSSGAFVTLKIGGDLRGCIGTVLTYEPLYRVILNNSYKAAFRDPRFMPVTAREFRDVVVEISILTRPVDISSIEEITVGKHGLMIEKGPNRGLLLPQVAVEQHWNREQFLLHTCRKAGLPDDAWTGRDVRIQRFEAIIFSEESI